MTKWLGRGALVVAALALAGFGLFQMFKKPLALQVFERALADAVAADPVADLPDGLHVYLCGTGSPMPDVTRAGPCVGVLAGDRAFVFDTGSGGVRKLARMGFPMTRLDTLYLTHLHSDHIDGLGELLLQAWIAGERSAPLPVAGPAGTAETVAAFNAAYEIDRGYRIAHHGTDVANPAGFGGAPQEIALVRGPAASQTVLDEGGLKITAIRVDHSPVEPAFAYRIDYKDRSLALSGDTVYHPGFVAAAKDVDLMLHEALDPDLVLRMRDALSEAGQANTAAIMQDILDYHATPEDAARAASEAGAAALVYYHIVPPLPARLLYPVFIGEAPSVFDGDIAVGEDGMMISLPAGSDAIDRRRAF